MKKYTADELKEICLSHLKWLRNETGGKCADLTDANLTYANLTDANLTYANLTRANLTDANLTCANLTDANLTCANLTRANLTDANLTYANLTCANLTRANLTDANLTRAKNSELAIAQTVIVPAGELIGWKKCRTGNKTCIVKMRIPVESRRSNATGRKCRAERVVVEEIFPPCDDAVSMMQAPGILYTVGKTIECDSWDENRFNECSGGIHFFITREEAEAWE